MKAIFTFLFLLFSTVGFSQIRFNDLEGLWILNQPRYNTNDTTKVLIFTNDTLTFTRDNKIDCDDRFITLEFKEKELELGSFNNQSCFARDESNDKLIVLPEWEIGNKNTLILNDEVKFVMEIEDKKTLKLIRITGMEEK